MRWALHSASRMTLASEVGQGYVGGMSDPGRLPEAEVIDKPATSSKRSSRRTGERKVTFGSVTVMVRPPTKAEVQRNVEQSTKALARALKRLVRPGVRLYPKRGVPLYWGDEERPGKFVRLLDGKRDLGILENGEFKVTG